MSTTQHSGCSLKALVHSSGMMTDVPDIAVAGLTADSRNVVQGDVFVALDGYQSNGLDFAQSAEQRGAVAVLYESNTKPLPDMVIPLVGINDIKSNLGKMADQFYASPSSHLRVVGVTGTNGKTSVCHYVAESLQGTAGGCGFIGTTGVGSDIKALKPASITTPDVITVHGLLRAFRDASIDTVAMEVSSHALSQGRVDEVVFEVVVFTNLSRDHLDYHSTMETYALSKQQLLLQHSVRSVVINIDDPEGREWQKKAAKKMSKKAQVLTVSAAGKKQAGNHLYADNIALHASGIEFDLVTSTEQVHLTTTLLGRFNVDNLLLAAGVLLSLGYSLKNCGAMLESISAATGRMQAFGGADQPLVVVDFAHTSEALEQALVAMRQHCQSNLVVVFGCGGDRDVGKRPLMGEIAERLADKIIVTDDNSRNESPDAIVKNILSGMSNPQRVVVEHDRYLAISHAIKKSSPSDCILVAGKGHENHQISAGVRHEFNDRAVVRQLLKEYQQCAS